MFVIVLGVAVILAWIQRREIADDLIGDTLQNYGIPASYKVVSISTRRQVITDIVLGDPQRPDLTIDRAVFHIAPRFGFPEIVRIEAGEVRLYGRLQNGRVTFGSLDPLIYTGSDAPFEFPALDLSLADGRALIQSEYGDIGLKLAGSGYLRSGFTGQIAAVAPALSASACEGREVTFFGRVSVDAEKPRVEGPLRLASLACPDAGVAAEQAELQLDLRADRNLADFTGELALRGSRTSLPQAALAAVEGSGKFVFRGGNLTASYDLEGRDLTTPWAAAGAVSLEGGFRNREEFTLTELDGTVEARGLRIGNDLRGALGGFRASADGTLLAPLLDRFATALASETQVSTLDGNFTVRSSPEGTSAIVPSLSLRGTSGATILALSRGQVRIRDGVPVASGNFRTGGEGLPVIAGRVESDGGRGPRLSMRMARYQAKDASLELPSLELAWQNGGILALAGEVRASGTLPGGTVDNLRLPLSGSIGPGGTLNLWEGCTRAKFDALTVSSLSLQRQDMLLCPPRGRPIVAYGDDGLQLAAGVPSMDLRGTLAQTPIAIASGPIGFSWPGNFVARSVEVLLGPEGTATRFAITDLTASLGQEITGRFADTDLLMDAVPLDILGADGDWSYGDGRLTISGGSFTLHDRKDPARFEPLSGRGAVITLADNLIRGEFSLFEPRFGQKTADVALLHDLGTGAGRASLNVPGVTFAQGSLQPLDLSDLALGVVANVDGTVRGDGEVTWDAQGVRSAGSFTSDSLDFAAAFGPVQGASGTIRFTDLLGLTTAPTQVIRIDAVNPGIEVYDGEVALSLVDGELLRFEGGRWPFLGGVLTMQPVDLNIGQAEERRYVVVVDGLDSAKFVERMGLSNLAVTGVFDGTIPIVFDKDGNGQLLNGVLVSRAPGGHVSYVGQLTYEDLSYIGNFACQTVRDLQ